MNNIQESVCDNCPYDGAKFMQNEEYIFGLCTYPDPWGCVHFTKSEDEEEE